MLKIRRDAVYLKTSDGIIFRSISADFRLKGATIYNSFTGLLPYLNGSVSTETLLGGMDEAKRGTTRKLIDLLVDKGILRLVDPQDYRALEPAELARFEGQIEFIGHFCDDPAHRFARFRHARVALVGGGNAFVSAGLALLDNGLAELAIASDDEQALEDQSWEQTVCRLAAEGVAAKFTRVRQSDLDPACYDLIICCGNIGVGRANALFKKLGEATQCVVLPAFAHRDHTYIGPISIPRYPGCLNCALLRWSDMATDADGAEFWRGIALEQPLPLGTSLLSGTAAQMLGNGTALEAFRYLVGVPAAEAHCKLLDQDLSSLETAIRRFARHDDCRRCQPLPDDQDLPDPASDEQQVLARWAPFMGHPFATYGAFEDGAIEHLPVSVSLLPSPSGIVAGWSLENVLHARVEALAQAVRQTVLAGATDFPRQAVDTLDEALTCLRPSQILGWVGEYAELREGKSALRGMMVASGMGVLVPRAAIVPSPDDVGGFDIGLSGMGVDISLNRATERAVRHLLEREMVDLMAAGSLAPQAWHGPHDNEIDGDKDVAYLIDALRLMNAEVPKIAIVVHPAGLFGALLVPDHTASIAAGELRIASGARPIDAVRQLLLSEVAARQMQRQGFSVVHRSEPGIFSAVQIGLSRIAELPTWAGEQAIGSGDLHANLAAKGQAIVAVDVTPPDVRQTNTFTAVRTLLVSTGGD